MGQKVNNNNKIKGKSALDRENNDSNNYSWTLVCQTCIKKLSHFCHLLFTHKKRKVAITILIFLSRQKSQLAQYHRVQRHRNRIWSQVSLLARQTVFLTTCLIPAISYKGQAKETGIFNKLSGSEETGCNVEKSRVAHSAPRVCDVMTGRRWSQVVRNRNVQYCSERGSSSGNLTFWGFLFPTPLLLSLRAIKRIFSFTPNTSSVYLWGADFQRK